MNTVDDFVADLEPCIADIVEQMRSLILASAPGVEEMIKYKVPFYHYQGPLCYINPYSGHVVLGFTKGASLYNNNRLLTGTGKEVRHIVVHCGESIDAAGIRCVLQEAILLNELKKKP